MKFFARLNFIHLITFQMHSTAYLIKHKCAVTISAKWYVSEVQDESGMEFAGDNAPQNRQALVNMLRAGAF